MATSKTAKLTPTLVKTATPDEGASQLLIMDTVTPGFGLRVSRNKKSFIVQGRLAGTKAQPRITLYHEDKDGNPDGKPLTLEKARNMALIAIGKLKQGIHPDPDKQRSRIDGTPKGTGEYTLQDAWKHYQTYLKKAKCRPNTFINYQRWIKYLDCWMNTPLASITPAMVDDLHTKIHDDVQAGTRGGKETSGETTSNNAMRLLRAIYNLAAKRHRTLPQNPCGGITFYKEVSHRTAIEPEQLPAWWQEVHALENPIRRDAQLLALFTGLRKMNVLEAQWQHVDLDKRTLHIPVTKSGKPFTLPLSDFLVELLENRRAENAKLYPKSPWVFPGDGKTGHFTKLVDRRKQGTIAHVLRHSFVTVAQAVVPNYLHVKLLVNHAKPTDDMTARYAHPTVEDLRVSMEMVTDRLMALCNPAPESDKVVIIGKRKQA